MIMQCGSAIESPLKALTDNWPSPEPRKWLSVDSSWLDNGQLHAAFHSVICCGCSRGKWRGGKEWRRENILACCVSAACYLTHWVCCICLNLEPGEITDLYQLLIPFKLQMTSFYCWGVTFFHFLSQFSYFTDEGVMPGGAVLRLPSDPVWACKSLLLIMACQLDLRTQAASSLSIPSQRPWLLTCCLTSNRRLYVVH